MPFFIGLYWIFYFSTKLISDNYLYAKKTTTRNYKLNFFKNFNDQ